MKRVTPETALKREILDALKKLGIRHWRMNAGGYRGRAVGHPKGTPDLLMLPSCQPPLDGSQGVSWRKMVCWIEIKAPGGRLSPEQLKFADSARNAGEHWLLAESIEDVLDFLKGKS